LRIVVALAAAATVAGGTAEAAGGGPSGPVEASAAATAPRVQVTVVGQTRTLLAPKTVIARARTVRVGRRRCAIAAGTALAGLEAARRAGGPSYRLRDYGTCSRRAGDAASLFVLQIGSERNRGSDGWVYKIARRVPTAGAADPAGRRLRRGERLTWFYCRMQRRGGCQRTLELSVPGRAAPGAPLRAVVRGYDDEGRGTPVAGATVTLAAVTGVTGPDGTATLIAPAAAGRYRAMAERPGLVPAFPAEVRVG
jgi:hypothetical protein